MMVSTNESERQSLFPVDVPWMVAADHSRIIATLVENDRAVIAFDASVLPEGGVDEILHAELPIKRVVLQFRAAQWMRTAPAWSDRDVVDPLVYDWGKVYSVSAFAGSVNDYLIGFRRKWQEDRRCPDPALYEVGTSYWLVQSGAVKFQCRHYLLLGHDLSVEVLAPAFTWQWDTEAWDVGGIRGDNRDDRDDRR